MKPVLGHGPDANIDGFSGNDCLDNVRKKASETKISTGFHHSNDSEKKETDEDEENKEEDIKKYTLNVNHIDLEDEGYESSHEVDQETEEFFRTVQEPQYRFNKITEYLTVNNILTNKQELRRMVTRDQFDIKSVNNSCL